MTDLTDEQIHRYARHIVLPEIGEEGQARLLTARILVVGAGGLGAPVLMYLAAAGVGTLGIIDDDIVDLSNLQRQIIHTTSHIGTAKVVSAAVALKALNPEVKVERYQRRLEKESARHLIENYDLVIDGSDNFATRYILNDLCYQIRRPLIMGSLLRFEGQISLFKAYDIDAQGQHGPCYRCVFPEPPPANIAPGCAQAGILGAIAGVIGALQAGEAIKEILGFGDSLSGRLLLYDGLKAQIASIALSADPDCPVCGYNRGDQ
ncbi:MAG: molybdopterin-synthase adenylyltransferase MoeB [Alphaproteobacteria bacterium]